MHKALQVAEALSHFFYLLQCHKNYKPAKVRTAPYEDSLKTRLRSKVLTSKAVVEVVPLMDEKTFQNFYGRKFALSAPSPHFAPLHFAPLRAFCYYRGAGHPLQARSSFQC
ncbi:MAG: hypothetical protein JST36_00645 [Bacteroidetes bacterium]|nr:hypothetical protein [Bacteroidota bacterium]